MTQAIKISTKDFFNNALRELQIDGERTKLLCSISNSIIKSLQEKSHVNLNFICTHNSRRSQFAQVWSHYAIQYFNIPNCKSFSGGTEATAFFRNTVKSLQSVGFNFRISQFSHRNPIYEITFENCTSPIMGFSKVFNHPANKMPFIAITTCSHADENCPFIPEAKSRFHLPFTDPKKFDTSFDKYEEYLKTSKQIAGELHYIFKQVKNSI